MSYTPHEWQNDELITAAKMNNIEEGIAEGGGGAVIITDNGTQLDKTYAEIYALVNSGTPCYIKYNRGNSKSDLDEDYTYYVALAPVVLVYKYDSYYRIHSLCSATTSVGSQYYFGKSSTWVYQASVSTDYPTFYRQAYVNDSYLSVSDNRDW